MEPKPRTRSSEATTVEPPRPRHSKAIRRWRWPAVAIAVVALALAAPACGGDDDEDEAPAPPTTEAPEQQGDQGGQAGGQEGGGQEAGGEQAGGDAAAGEQIFADNCATCHGNEGEGGTGPSLQNPDLTVDQVTEQVRNGGGGMPPFEGQLSDQQIADVAAFVTEDLAQR